MATKAEQLDKMTSESRLDIAGHIVAFVGEEGGLIINSRLELEPSGALVLAEFIKTWFTEEN